MNVRIKHIITLFLVLFSVATTYAGNIFGRVVDSEKEPLIQASVRLLAAKDSAYVKGGATNEQGRFRINNVKSGKYILQATYVGYEPTYKNITVGTDNLRVGEIVMNESSIMLKETTVIGVKTPIKVMEDTVEYNADTYKTQPNAVVEDLLKRMSGVEVSSDGKITAHGKEVTKILVDGKEFFSDDPTVASKNLPANMIDKLQVIDRKSDLARLTGVDDGEDETVINLTVKKGMKNGWFGTVDAGYGTDNRYKGIFNVNRFWNDNQITFLGNFNNVNEMGFADGGGNFRRFGGNNGINTSQAFGVNFNVGNKEIFRVGGDVMYSHSDRDNIQTTKRQYLYTDINSMANMDKLSRDNGHNIRASFRVQWNPDSTNTFEFRPNFRANFNDSWSKETSATNTIGQGYILDQTSQNLVNSNGTSYNFGGSLVYNHKFKSRPGRSFSFQGRYQFSNVSEFERTLSINRNTYTYADSIDEDILDYAQYADNHTWNNMAQGRVTWTEPLGNVKNGHFLTFAYRAQYRWNNADKYTYSAPSDVLNNIVLNYLTDDRYSHTNLEELFYGYEFEPNDSLTIIFRNEYFNQDIRVGRL